MVNNNKALQVAKYAVMFAIIFVAMMIDKVISIIPIPFSMAVCVLLVTLSFCFLENKWSTAVMSGLFFGVASFIKEFIWGSPLLGAVLPPVYWPFVTIPSRVLMTTLAFGAYRLLLMFTRNIKGAKKRQILCMTVAAFVGLVVNTLGFITSVYAAKEVYVALTHTIMENKGVFALIYGILLTNVLPEYSVSLICVSFIVLGVRRGLKLGVDGNNWKLTANQTADKTESSTETTGELDGDTEGIKTVPSNIQTSKKTEDGENE